MKNKLAQSLRSGVLLLALGLLASCTSVSSLSAPNTSTHNGYLLTVKVVGSDTSEAIAAKFGGEVLVWRAKDGFAILKLSDAQQKALQARSEVMAQTTALDPNSTVKGPEIGMQGVGAWSGGVGAWSGGYGAWSSGWNTWGGGWNTWGGGTTYTVPELPSPNRYKWNLIRLPQAQGITKNFGSGIEVAVLDTGLDLEHPAFQGRLAPSSEWKDFVDGDGNPAEAMGSGYGHGTGVAGIIAQIAPRATILPIRVLGADGMGDLDQVIAAMDWAIQKGAQVINVSLGTDTSIATFQQMVDYATSLGVFVVASAGNTSSGSLTYPAEWAKTGTGEQYLISVGSTAHTDIVSSFSNNGTNLELLAPGETVLSAYPGNQAAHYIGTSFAAPQVAGALAAAMGDTAQANWAGLQSNLVNSGSSTPSGIKRLDVANLLRRALDYAPLKALYVGSTPAPTAVENTILSRMALLGYHATYKDDDVAVAADANGKRMVMFGSTVSSAVVANQFRDVAVPVVVGNADLFDDMMMTGNVAGTDYAAIPTGSISITNASHPMAAGMSGSTSVISNSYTSWGRPLGAIVVATLPTDPSKAVLFGYDTGAQMVGMTAPARRVGYFAKNGPTGLSKAGLMLFEAAVTWALSGN